MAKRTTTDKSWGDRRREDTEIPRGYLIRLNASESLDLVAALRQTGTNPALAERIKTAAERTADNQVFDETLGYWISIPPKE